MQPLHERISRSACFFVLGVLSKDPGVLSKDPGSSRGDNYGTSHRKRAPDFCEFALSSASFRPPQQQMAEKTKTMAEVHQ